MISSEKDTIYWQDHRGVIRNMSIKDYESNTRSRTIIHDCMGIIKTGDERNISEVQRDDASESGTTTSTQRKNSGQSIPSTSGKKETETHDTKPVRELEKKDPRPTRSLEVSGQNIGMQH